MQRKRLPMISLSFLLLCLAACGEDNAQGEGPMEQSGKAVDKAAEKTGEVLKEGVETVGEGVEKVGEKMQGSDTP